MKHQAEHKPPDLYSLLNMQDSLLEELCAPDVPEEIKAERTTTAALTNLCVLRPPRPSHQLGDLKPTDDNLGRVPTGFQADVAVYFDVADDTPSTCSTGLLGTRESLDPAPSHHQTICSPLPTIYYRVAPFYQFFKFQPREV